MKKVWLSSAAVVAPLTSSLAFAADLPVKAPAAAPIAFYNWTGCYVGGRIGGAFTEDTATNVFGASRSHNSSGFVGGG
jgi:outer membrane immunogenic protein